MYKDRLPENSNKKENLLTMVREGYKFMVTWCVISSAFQSVQLSLLKVFSIVLK